MSATVTLREDHAAIPRQLIGTGRFPDAESAVGRALEMLRAEQEGAGGWTLQALRQAVQQGIESGPGNPGDDVFDRLEAKYARMERERAGR